MNLDTSLELSLVDKGFDPISTISVDGDNIANYCNYEKPYRQRSGPGILLAPYRTKVTILTRTRNEQLEAKLLVIDVTNKRQVKFFDLQDERDESPKVINTKPCTHFYQPASKKSPTSFSYEVRMRRGRFPLYRSFKIATNTDAPLLYLPSLTEKQKASKIWEAVLSHVSHVDVQPVENEPSSFLVRDTITSAQLVCKTDRKHDTYTISLSSVDDSRYNLIRHFSTLWNFEPQHSNGDNLPAHLDLKAKITEVDATHLHQYIQTLIGRRPILR